MPLFSSEVVSPAGIPLDPDTFFVTQTLTRAYGVYAQDQAKLPGGFELLAGLRYQSVSSLGYTTSGLNFGGSGSPEPQPETHDTAVTPRAAVLWQPDQRLSLYTSYTENFGASNAANGTDWQGKPLKAEIARQYELGAKADFFDRRANASFAWFDLTKTNVAAPDLAHPNGAGGFFPTTVGQVESRGIEFTVQGELSPGLGCAVRLHARPCVREGRHVALSSGQRHAERAEGHAALVQHLPVSPGCGCRA